MKTILRQLTSWGHLTILSGLLTTSAPADQLDLTQSLPPGAIAVISYAGGEKLAADYEKSTLGQIFNDPQMQAFLRKPKEKVVSEIASQTNAPSADAIRQIKRWFVAKESALAVYADPGFGIVGCTRLGKDADEARKLLESMTKDHGATARKSGKFSVTVAGDKTEFAVAKDTFIFANDSARMDKMLARIDSGTTTVATKAPSLPVGKPIGWAVMDTPALLGRIRTEIKDAKELEKFDGVMSALGVDTIGTVATAAGFDGPAIRAISHVPTSSMERGIFSWYGQTKPLDEKALKLVPRDVAMGSVSRFEAAAAWDGAMAVVKVVSGDFQKVQDKLAELEKELQFKFKEDLVDSVGDVIVVYSKATPASMMGGEMAIVLSLKDSKSFASCIDKLSEYGNKKFAQQQKTPQMAIKQSEVEGTRIYYLAGFPMMMPAWAVKGDYWYVSLSPQAVQAAMAQVENPKTSLLDNEDFRNSRSKLPENAIAVTYEDIRQSVAGIYGLAAMIGPMFAGKPDAPVDVGLLPPLATIQSKLYGSVQVVTVDNKGIMSHQYSPLGISLGGFSGAQGTAVLAGMLMPALGQAREKARQANCSSNLKQIGLACMMYADEHNGKFPDRLEDLSADILPNRKVFTCPSATTGAGGPSYVYIKGVTPGNPDRVLAHDADGNHRTGRNVLYGDGRVQWMSEADFQKAIGQDKKSAQKTANTTR